MHAAHSRFDGRGTSGGGMAVNEFDGGGDATRAADDDGSTRVRGTETNLCASPTSCRLAVDATGLTDMSSFRLAESCQPSVENPTLPHYNIVLLDALGWVLGTTLTIYVLSSTTLKLL